MRPMLATATDAVPAGPGWVHEVKWDGMRVLCDVGSGRVVVTSRTERDITVAFPELNGIADEFEDMLLDGEVVVMRDGRPSFSALAERIHVTDARRARILAAEAPATLMVFDLLRLFGTDLMAHPWRDRRATLERLELSGARWQTPQTFTDGATLLEVTREQGLEGIVSKRVSSIYQPGVRSREWLKLPHRATVSVVIGGWRPEAGGGAARRLGAVLVGVPVPGGGLRYLGRVGSGLAGKAGTSLLGLLDETGSAASELASEYASGSASGFVDEVPPEDADVARWVPPRIVVDVESLGLSGTGRLRQPAFKRVRTDLSVDDVMDPWAGEDS